MFWSELLIWWTFVSSHLGLDVHEYHPLPRTKMLKIFWIFSIENGPFTGATEDILRRGEDTGEGDFDVLFVILSVHSFILLIAIHAKEL